MITKNTIYSLEDAFLYLADCQLATVSSMAMKKSRQKFEYERQISIAQMFVDKIRSFKLKNDSGNRVNDILNLPSQSVAEWAKKYEPPKLI
jgi:hypothetical protein